MRKLHWLEYGSTVVALFVSIVSLWVAVRTEQANSRMVDANYKMVAAASWPFLQVRTSNSDDGRKTITLQMENAGVGPAKLQSFEVFWRGQAFSNSTRLLEACCGLNTKAPYLVTTAPTTGVLRAGDSLKFLKYDQTPDNDAVWKAFDRARFSELTYRVCYCSVFDECRVSDLKSQREQVVKACPKPAIPYTE